MARFQVGSEFGASKLQHLRGAIATQLARSLSTRQRLLRRGLVVRVMEIGPVRGEFEEFALLLPD